MELTLKKNHAAKRKVIAKKRNLVVKEIIAIRHVENIANNTLSRIFLHPVTFVDTRFLAGIFFVANTEPCRVYGF